MLCIPAKPERQSANARENRAVQRGLQPSGPEGLARPHEISANERCDTACRVHHAAA